MTIASLNKVYKKTPLLLFQVVGGGSTVNGMLYVRGDQEDYDAWERKGNPGDDDAIYEDDYNLYDDCIFLVIIVMTTMVILIITFIGIFIVLIIIIFTSGWGWRDVLPFFKASEDQLNPSYAKVVLCSSVIKVVR